MSGSCGFARLPVSRQRPTLPGGACARAYIGTCVGAPAFSDRTGTMASLGAPCGISRILRGGAAPRRLRQPRTASATCTIASGSRCRIVPGLPVMAAAVRTQEAEKSHGFGALPVCSTPLACGSGGGSARGRGRLGVARGWRRGRSQISEPARSMPEDR